MHYGHAMSSAPLAPWAKITPAMQEWHLQQMGIGAEKMKEDAARYEAERAAKAAAEAAAHPPSDYGFVKVAAVVGVIGVLYLIFKKG